VASLLKRWLLGTYQGAVKPTHLAYYLDEFTFRFNRRTSRSRGKLFYRLVEQALLVDPIPGKSLNVGHRILRNDDDFAELNPVATTTFSGHLSKVHTPLFLIGFSPRTPGLRSRLWKYRLSSAVCRSCVLHGVAVSPIIRGDD